MRESNATDRVQAYAHQWTSISRGRSHERYGSGDLRWRGVQLRAGGGGVRAVLTGGADARRALARRLPMISTSGLADGEHGYDDSHDPHEGCLRLHGDEHTTPIRQIAMTAAPILCRRRPTARSTGGRSS